jgi:hypothetical protein
MVEILLSRFGLLNNLGHAIAAASVGFWPYQTWPGRRAELESGQSWNGLRIFLFPFNANIAVGTGCKFVSVKWKLVKLSSVLGWLSSSYLSFGVHDTAQLE